MEHLSTLAQEQAQSEATVADLEAQLKQEKAHLRHVSEVQIPELMDELGIETFKTTEGFTITVKEKIRASLTQANLFAGVEWLRENGHGAIVKRIMSVVPTSEEEAEIIKAALKDFDLTDKPSVHANTLSKWAREMLEDGRTVPEELFGLFRQRVSKVQLPR